MKKMKMLKTKNILEFHLKNSPNVNFMAKECQFLMIDDLPLKTCYQKYQLNTSNSKFRNYPTPDLSKCVPRSPNLFKVPEYSPVYTPNKEFVLPKLAPAYTFTPLKRIKRKIQSTYVTPEASRLPSPRQRPKNEKNYKIGSSFAKYQSVKSTNESFDSYKSD